MTSRRLPQQGEHLREPPAGNQFGTFAGVFTPTILTILGVIMFLRAGFVVGQGGVLGAVLILLLAKSITLLTSLSVSAISTNTQVRGGGAYFIISRVLGPEFGGAIGVALFFAQALSVPFYILGFTEALVDTVDPLRPYFLTISLTSGLSLFLIAYVGAGWAMKAQFLIMAVLGAAVVVMLGGLALDFRGATFLANWGAAYDPIDPAHPARLHSFWSVFAIYFPAVTGILAGVNMSGDLKNPARSIPLGTLTAVAASFVIYLGQLLLLGGASARGPLNEGPYEVLQAHALWGLTPCIAAGVFAATLSSALGSYLGAPRILQAVARDRILEPLRPFALGTPYTDEPRRALVLTAVMTFAVLLWAGNDSGGGPLNAVAAIITMFFLYTYGMTNLAAFIEAATRNPSFRPRFRFFHWSTGLLGAISCVAVALLIDAIAAVVAASILGALLWTIRRRQLEASFGDARRGFVYSALRRNMLRLASMAEDTRNWRPTILVLSGNPASRETLVSYAVWLESGRGIVLLANVLQGGFDQALRLRRRAEAQLRDFCRAKSIEAFPVVAVGEDPATSIGLLLQSVTIGPIRPNLAMFGWTDDPASFERLAKLVRIANSAGMSVVLTRDRGVPQGGARRIDVWWRGRANGGLMVLLSHLLTHNWEWVRAQIRVLRLVDGEGGRDPAAAALQELIDEARVDAQAHCVVAQGRGFAQVLREESQGADCVILGFQPPPAGEEQAWHAGFAPLVADLPTTLIVHSLGQEDLLA